MRTTFENVLNHGESKYDKDDYVGALIFYKNVIKHFDRKFGVPLLVLRGMLPYIPVDAWSFLTSNYVYYMGLHLNINYFTKY